MPTLRFRHAKNAMSDRLFASAFATLLLTLNITSAIAQQFGRNPIAHC